MLLVVVLLLLLVHALLPLQLPLALLLVLAPPASLLPPPVASEHQLLSGPCRPWAVACFCCDNACWGSTHLAGHCCLLCVDDDCLAVQVGGLESQLGAEDVGEKVSAWALPLPPQLHYALWKPVVCRCTDPAQKVNQWRNTMIQHIAICQYLKA
jgi:hypothetical protein